MSSQGTSLAAQWLRHKAPSGRVQGSVPGQGTRSDMLQLRVPILQLDQRPHTLQLRPGTAKYIYVCACMLSHFSCVPLCATLWTAAHQALLSIGFSRLEWVAMLSSRGSSQIRDGILSPALGGGFLPLAPPGIFKCLIKTQFNWRYPLKMQLVFGYAHRSEPWHIIKSALEGVPCVSWSKWGKIQLHVYNTLVIHFFFSGDSYAHFLQ